MEDIIMRVRHSKLLALIGAGILAVTALVACGKDVYKRQVLRILLMDISQEDSIGLVI